MAPKWNYKNTKIVFNKLSFLLPHLASVRQITIQPKLTALVEQMSIWSVFPKSNIDQQFGILQKSCFANQHKLVCLELRFSTCGQANIQ